MTDAPVLISVVLTTYKRSHLLLNSVNSVLEGSYPNFELIIVNDCSPDDTDEVVKQITDQRVRYLKLSQNGGVLAARNRGFDVAKGDFITILDDDDILVPNALEQIVDAYASLKPEERGVLWFDCIDKESEKISGTMTQKGGVISFNDYVCGRIKGDFWLVFARHVLEGNRFDERLRAHESLFWLKLHRIFPARHVAAVLCIKSREHGERLCDLNIRLGQLSQTLFALKEFERQFGADLRKLCPLEYGRKLAYLGLHQLMSGESLEGRRSIYHSLTYCFSMKYIVIYFVSLFVGAKGIVRLYVYNENRG